MESIAYLIMSYNNNATGGHYRSLFSIYNYYRAFYNIKVINIGFIKSPVFTSVAENDFIFFKINLFNFFYSFIKIFKYLNKNNFDIFHCYDTESLFIAKLYILLNNNSNIKLIYTKCGGPNFKFYPFAPVVVTFSIENYLQNRKLTAK